MMLTPKFLLKDTQGIDTKSIGRYNELYTGEILYEDQILCSNNGKFTATLHKSGKLCLFYTISSRDLKNAFWSTDFDRRIFGPFKMVMEVDGNLVISGENGIAWASGTHKRGMGCRLFLRDDGNLVILDQFNKVIWSSETNR